VRVVKTRSKGKYPRVKHSDFGNDVRLLGERCRVRLAVQSMGVSCEVLDQFLPRNRSNVRGKKDCERGNLRSSRNRLFVLNVNVRPPAFQAI
jgi:hypothetical protein